MHTPQSCPTEISFIHSCLDSVGGTEHAGKTAWTHCKISDPLMLCAKVHTHIQAFTGEAGSAMLSCFRATASLNVVLTWAHTCCRLVHACRRASAADISPAAGKTYQAVCHNYDAKLAMGFAGQLLEERCLLLSPKHVCIIFKRSAAMGAGEPGSCATRPLKQGPQTWCRQGWEVAPVV